MEWILIFGIAIGLGLDLYARSVCQGALLSKICKSKFLIGLFLFGIYELVILVAGFLLSSWLHVSQIADKGDEINYLISMVIFGAIGIRMIFLAIRNEEITEKRQSEDYVTKMFLRLSFQISINIFLVGIGIGIGQLLKLSQLFLLAFVGLIGIVLGLISGYHLGYRQKTKAYAFGGATLLCLMFVIGYQFLL